MPCETGTQNLTRYLDGTLVDDARRRYELHLQGCADCRQELDLWLRLEDLPDSVPNSARMRHNFERALAAEIAPTRRTPALPWFAWAAAAAVLVASGWLIGHLTSGPAQEPPTEMTALRQEVSSLRSMVALSLLSQESASSRLQGISYAGRLKQESPDVVGALVSALRYDSNVNVRLAAADALRRYRSEAPVRQAFVAALGTEESPLVKVTLIDALADFGERDSVPPLLRLRASGEENSVVRERAARALDVMKSKGIKWE
jgi:hypothetical protein